MYLNKKKIKNLEAMVFAAGRGKRMRYMTNFKAKPLVEINQECLLDTNIKKIASSGISKIIVNASYKHLSIKKSLNNLKLKNKLPELIVSYEKNLLETGGGLKKVVGQFENYNLLVVNGDSLLHSKNIKSCPISTLKTNFNKKKMDVLLLLSKKKNTLGYNGKGDYKKISYSNASKLSKEKSNFPTKYIFTGWQIINKKILNNFSEKKFSLKKVYDLAEKNGRLYGIIYSGLFFHVGDSKSYNQIKNFINIKKLVSL